MRIFLVVLLLLLNIAKSITEQQMGEVLRTNNMQAIEDLPPSNQLIQAITQQIQRLKAIDRQIVLSSSRIQPVLKWGQNKSHIFITIKTSHRWDSPPCLNTKFKHNQLHSHNFTFLIVCHSAHVKITFQIELQFHAAVAPKTDKEGNVVFSLENDGVGVYSTIISKQRDGIWGYLSTKKKHYPIWEEISGRYPEQFKQYQKMHPQMSSTKKKSENSFFWNMFKYIKSLFW